MEMRSDRCLLLLLTAFLATDLRSQEDPPVVRAERFVKQLELPRKRGDAMHGLWQLGAAAAPALARALRDPRPEVVQAACAVINEIGPAAGQLRVHLERQLDNGGGAHEAALQWALHGITDKSVVVANWNGSVVILDASGKVVQEHQNVTQPWGVQMLPGGHFLTAQLTEGVHEYGEKVWSYSGKLRQALRAQRLIDGTTVIVEGQKQIGEYDASGKKRWSYAGTTSCAMRLLNGHYVLVDSAANKLREIDRDGKTLRSWDVPAHCYGIRRLPNGNTLLTTRTNNRILEYDPDGKLVKERRLEVSPNDVMLRHDGVLLVADFNGVLALDADDKELWRYKGQMIGGLGR